MFKGKIERLQYFKILYENYISYVNIKIDKTL